MLVKTFLPSLYSGLKHIDFSPFKNLKGGRIEENRLLVKVVSEKNTSTACHSPRTLRNLLPSKLVLSDNEVLELPCLATQDQLRWTCKIFLSCSERVKITGQHTGVEPSSPGQNNSRK